MRGHAARVVDIVGRAAAVLHGPIAAKLRQAPLFQSCMVRPTMDWPRSRRSAATVELSTPPLMATATSMAAYAARSRSRDRSSSSLDVQMPSAVIARPTRAASGESARRRSTTPGITRDRAVNFFGSSVAAEAEAQARARVFVCERPAMAAGRAKARSSRRSKPRPWSRRCPQVERDHESLAAGAGKSQIGCVGHAAARYRHSRARRECAQAALARGGRAARAMRAASSARRWRASSAALPRPTMPGTFSVPGRRSRS